MEAARSYVCTMWVESDMTAGSAEAVTSGAMQVKKV